MMKRFYRSSKTRYVADLSFWRVVLILSLTISPPWTKGSDSYYLHVGTFSKDDKTALKVIFLPLMIMIGFIL